jgi:PPP family 3-phenylpropionic acid transporter
MTYKAAIRTSYFLCFLAMGSALPFLPIFLKERMGLSNRELGLVLMIRPAMALLGQPFWSWMADSTPRRSRLASAMAVLAAGFFPLVMWGRSLPALMGLMAMSAFFMMPLNSMSDTITFDYLGQSRRNHFGSFRIFASLGWFLAVLSVGLLYDSFGLRWLFLFFALGMLGSAWFIQMVPSRRSEMRKDDGRNPLLEFLKKRNVLFFIAAILISETANQMAYVFLGVYAKSLGANNAQAGWIWATATGAEIFTMASMPWILRKFGLKRVLFLGTSFILVRWAPFAFVTDWWMLLPFQLIHLITLTFIYVGAAIFMDAEASPGIRFSAQAFFSTFVLNSASILGSLLGGEISQRWGYPRLYLVSGLLGIVASVILAAFVRNPSHVHLPREKRPLGHPSQTEIRQKSGPSA